MLRSGRTGLAVCGGLRAPSIADYLCVPGACLRLHVGLIKTLFRYVYHLIMLMFAFSANHLQQKDCDDSLFLMLLITRLHVNPHMFDVARGEAVLELAQRL